MNAEETLNHLLRGNDRFAAGELTHPHQTVDRRSEVVKGQRPSACILTCSDSRTPPEIIFDQGIGDIFIVRTAGNVADEAAIGSMEIAVKEFSVPLIMILGHQYCGAIKLAIENPDVEGHISSIIRRIKPAVTSALGQLGDIMDVVAQENVRNVVFQLKQSQPILAGKINEGKLKVVGAYYWLDDGKVEIID